MSLKTLVSKYIWSADRAFSEIKTIEKSKVEAGNLERVLESAKNYLEDAKYYMERKEFEVSLVSVAYCEGLLDALRMLGAVKFEWPSPKNKEK
jgi:FAD synthetase